MDPSLPDDAAPGPGRDRGHEHEHRHLHPAPTQPLPVNTAKIIWAGMACWSVALVVMLLVPPLRSGSRDWWPWACVTGLVLGAMGLAYVRRGRGNAAGARRG
jgi:hypothetical protein